MLSQLLQPTLATTPDQPLLEFYGRFWSCGELEASARNLALGLLAAGLEPMDRVAVLLPNRPETVLAYLACFKAGLVIVPLDFRHRAVQINYSLNHSGAAALIVHENRLAELEQEGVLPGAPNVFVVGEAVPARYRPIADVLLKEHPGRLPERFEGDDLCMMIYTSGTTARPKGVMLTRGAVEEGVRKYLAQVPMASADVALIATPITRPMALRAQLLPLLRVGGCASLIEQFDANQCVAALQRPPAKTLIALLPAQLSQVLRSPGVAACDFRELRFCMSGGEHVPPSLHDEFRRRTGVELTEQCGSSEAGPFAQNPPFGRKKRGSIGLPVYGVQICIVDESGEDVAAGETGEIVIKSSFSMDGYWNDTALSRKTMRNGWIRTGDLGRFDADRYLWFMGRKRDVIIRGGSNVSPLEVETVLLSHPSVAEACVFGVTHDELGQEVQAVVILHAGPAPPEKELRAFAAQRLAEYMVPARIHRAEEMPRKGPGKIDRDRLRMRFETGVHDL
jgi:long-chain acyl-CoA synthetase